MALSLTYDYVSLLGRILVASFFLVSAWEECVLYLPVQFVILYLIFFGPVLYNFFDNKDDKKEYSYLYIEFMQSLALFGAFHIYVGMDKMLNKYKGMVRELQAGEQAVRGRGRGQQGRGLEQGRGPGG